MSRSLPGNGVHDVFGYFSPRLWRDAQGSGDRVGNGCGIADRGELDQPDPIGELIGQVGGDLYRKAGLADPTRTGERDQAMLAYQPAQLRQLLAPADHARRLDRQVPGDDTARSKFAGGVTGLEARTVNAVQELGAPQALHVVLAERDQHEVRGNDVNDDIMCAVRHEDLAAGREAADACRTIHGAAVVVAVAQLSFTGM